MADRSFPGTAMTVIAGLLFVFLCMLFPLVGRAGSEMPFRDANRMFFSGVASLNLIFAMGASAYKLQRRRLKGGALPYFSLALCLTVCVVMIALLLELLEL